MTQLSAYATGMTRTNIEEALRSVGKDPSAIEPGDLAALEEFHTLGRLATAQLAHLADIGPNDRVLDAGTGIGGSARFLAVEHGCSVTGVDLTDEYCDTARWINESAGLSDRIAIVQGDITDLPFDAGSFDVVVSQHVQMNVVDKGSLYDEACRVLAPGGRLAMWDITGNADHIGYPVPWATDPADSHVVSGDQLRAAVAGAGFRIEQWNDLTRPTAEMMTAFLSRPASELGLHVFVPDFPAKVANMLRGFAAGYLQVIQALAVRPPDTGSS
ncbi:class I SAM-dependent methyltransferase [Jongsikchunia kroppenstedtii]|uniref:class I SAM-dependent methyltransferase n=1 Tax=Jongsikchunia kroppenstedtii TaxID=1121721 RepID=UPI000362ADAA|nr:class I SAM-dependent methyltransferase [Jongsikchunia kroppenstedtii]